MKELYQGIYLDTKVSTKYKSNLMVIKFISPYSAAAASKRSLLARMIEDGSESIKNKGALEQKLASLYGASLGVSVHRNGNFLEFTLKTSLVRPSLIEDLAPDILDQWYTLIESLLFEQNFSDVSQWDATRFNREKQLLLSRMNRQKDDKEQLVTKKLLEKIYQNDASKSLDGFGSEELLVQLSLADVAQEYRKLIDESLVLIATHGEFEEARLTEVIKKWPLSGRDKRYNYTENQISINSEVYTFHSQAVEGKQTHLAMGYSFPFISTLKGRVQMQVLNAILGGLPNSLLFMEIREKQSLAYSIYSSIDFSRSLLAIYAAIDGQTIDHVMSEIGKLFDVLKEQIAEPAYLEEVKFSLISDYVQSRDYQDTELYLQINQFLQPTFPRSLSIYREYVKGVKEADLLALLKDLKAVTTFVLKGRD